MIRFKRQGRITTSGGTLYESTCGTWHLFRESPKTRAGRRLRQWWYVTHRVAGTNGLYLPLTGRGMRLKYRTRRAAIAAVNAFAEQARQQELFV